MSGDLRLGCEVCSQHHGSVSMLPHWHGIRDVAWTERRQGLRITSRLFGDSMRAEQSGDNKAARWSRWGMRARSYWIQMHKKKSLLDGLFGECGSEHWIQVHNTVA